MTKPKLEAKLLTIINHYQRLYETLRQAETCVRKGKYERAIDYINIIAYRIEQTQITLESTLKEIELTRKINNKHDTRQNED